MPQKELFLILHDIRSAYNVGAIFRSADGAGVKKIFLTGYTPVPAEAEKPFKTKAEKMIEKTALGAEQMVTWEKRESLENLLKELAGAGCNIVALEKMEGSIEIKKHKSIFPMALVLGNEVEGVSSEVLQKCDSIISLPMRGKKESLNVSVAAGIALYELLT